MAKRTLIVEVVGDTDKLHKALDKANSAAATSGGKLKSVGKAAAIGLGGGLAVAGIAVKGFVDAAKDSEVVQKAMETQLGALGISYDKHAKAIDKSIQKTSQLSGLDDEDLATSFTNIVRVTGNVNESLKLNALAADIARAKHIDVAKAGALVAKMAGGNTKALSKYGLVVEKGATTQEALATAQAKFAGQAKAYGGTAAGAQERFQVAVENLQEKLGGALLPIVGKVANAVSGFVTGLENGTGVGGAFSAAIGDMVGTVKDAVTWLGRHKSLVTDLGIVVGVATAAFVLYRGAQIAGAAATAIMTGAQTALNVVLNANPISLVLIGLVALGAGLVIAYHHSETFRDIVNGAFEAIKNVVSVVLPIITDMVTGAFDVIKGVVKVFSGILTGDFGKAWDGVKEIFHGALDIVIGYISLATLPLRTALGAMAGVLSAAWEGIKGAASGAWGAVRDTILGAVRTARDLIGDVVTGIGNRLHDAWELIKGAVVAAWDFVRDRILGGVRAARDLIGEVLTGIANRLFDAWEGIKGTASGAWDFVKDRIVGALRGARDTIGDVLEGINNRLSDAWDLVKKGVSSVRDLFVDKFHDIKDIISKVWEWLDKVGKLVGNVVDLIGKIKLPHIDIPFIGGSGGAGGGNVGPGGALPSAVQGFDDDAARFGLAMTSGFRPGDDGYHGQNRARDYSNGTGTPQELAFANYMVSNFGSKLLELIHTPLGYGIKNGHKVGLGFWGAAVNADHFDHVHVAMENGGLVRRGGWALVGEKGPELARLPTGTAVYSNRESQGMLGGGATNVYLTENGDVSVGSHAAAQVLADRLSYRVRYG